MFASSHERETSQQIRSSYRTYTEMRDHGERTPVRQLDPSLFASLEDCDEYPIQCIAHTQQAKRCRQKIDLEDQLAATKWRRDVETLSDGIERDAAVRNFILFRCCDRSHHRNKLSLEDTGCFEEMIRNYSEKITKVEASPAGEKPASEPTQSETAMTMVEGHPQKDSEDQITPLPRSDGAMTLRSGTTLGNSTSHVESAEYFVPYKSQPYECLSKVLSRTIPSTYIKSGEVYSFTCPDHVGFTKIGYGRAASERISAWQRCEAGTTLSNSVFVGYPKRIERLIHLQLKEHRYKIGKCKAPDCGRTHVEWFKLPADEVNRVIGDWVEVMTREPLYDSDGKLTEDWHKRIHDLAGEITARALLDILDIEFMQDLSEEDLLSEDFLRGDSTLTEDEIFEDDILWDEVIEGDDTLIEAIQEKEVSPNSLDNRKLVEEPSLDPIGSIAQAELALATMVEIVPQAATTAMQIMDQQDQVLTFFEDFMSWMRQYEATGMVTHQGLSQGVSTTTTTTTQTVPPLMPVSILSV